MFGFFSKKRELKKFREEMQKSFNSVKEDFSKVGKWIDHLDGKHGEHGDAIEEIRAHLLSLQGDVDELKQAVSFLQPGVAKGVFKQPWTSANKQTTAVGVLTGVQTGVQTGILDTLTVMERAIVWALLNSELKLSYEDLATMLGKGKSTIRGQINTLKQKSEGLIEEHKEPNGKKRVYIPEEKKQFLVKSAKVRVKEEKKIGKR